MWGGVAVFRSSRSGAVRLRAQLPFQFSGSPCRREPLRAGCYGGKAGVLGGS